MTKRLDAVKLIQHQKIDYYLEILFSSSSMSECIGGVILYDETIKQDFKKLKFQN